jgi:YQGE family putative transporter
MIKKKPEILNKLEFYEHNNKEFILLGRNFMCKEAKLLLLLSILFTLAMGISSIFVNIFFWKQTTDFTVIVIYNLLQYIFIPINFLLAGIISKKKNGTWALRIGLGIFALFYMLILLIGSKGVIYIYMLGIISGIAAGFYWLAFNVLCFDFTDTTNRDTFNGYNGSVAGVATALAPLLSGYIISRFGGIKGYNIIFGITLSFLIVLILLSLKLKCKDSIGKLKLNRVFSKNCDDWQKIRISTVLWGFRDAIIGFLVNILIIEVTKSELSLGSLSLVGSLLSAAGFMIVQKIIKPRRRVASIYIGTILSFIAVIGISINVTYNNILIYILLNSFFMPFFVIQLSSSTFNVINRVHQEDLRIEYMINKDIALNLGRIISALILLILLTAFKTRDILKIYLLFIGFVPIFSGYYLSKLKKVLYAED